jgi:DNA polymerase theta
MTLNLLFLKVHDELVLEVDPCMVAWAGRLLQICMENAASLLGILFKLNWILVLIVIAKLKINLLFTLISVPLRTKIKVGKTWGSLEPFYPEPC